MVARRRLLKDEIRRRLGALPNFRKPIVEIRRSELQVCRDDPEIPWTIFMNRFCPTCRTGRMVPHLSRKRFGLEEKDICPLCGQRFIYTDFRRMNSDLSRLARDLVRILKAADVRHSTLLIRARERTTFIALRDRFLAFRGEHSFLRPCTEILLCSKCWFHAEVEFPLSQFVHGDGKRAAGARDDIWDLKSSFGTICDLVSSAVIKKSGITTKESAPRHYRLPSEDIWVNWKRMHGSYGSKQ